ncbi:MAG TPA: glycosyltransferase [Caulobacteraceae bacterium]|nr:glycosyltransferase [Caulobacteraceae bacterium]
MADRRLVVFGLTVSSSWGNGHATLWRGLIRALARRGWRTVFFERDLPYYRRHRDLWALEGAELALYPDWESIRQAAAAAVGAADAAMVTSYCPDAGCACALVRERARLSLFYDLDSPVTLARFAAGETVPYLPAGGLAGFDLVLSYAGGEVLARLATELGATRTAALYGHVDPAVHWPGERQTRFACDLSYLGAYAADRQERLERLFAAPARERPELGFLLGGAGYGRGFPWAKNIGFIEHIPPPEHAAFFASSRLTLNVSRADMATAGHCPSGRIFEAAACGCPVISDPWPGLERFFAPGEEILIARDGADVLQALALPAGELAAIGGRARERVLAEHTSEHRAVELERLMESAAAPREAAPSGA